MAKRLQITPMERAFIKAYLDDPDRDHIKAAKLSGYRQPETVGARLLRRLRPLIDEAYEKRLQGFVLTPEQVLQGLGEIAVDPGHRNRYDALRTMAQINGMLDGQRKPLDRKALLSEFQDVLRELRGATRGEIGQIPQSPISLPHSASNTPGSKS